MSTKHSRMVRLTLVEEMLGTKPADPAVFGTWVASKHPSGTPQKDELESVEHVEEAGTTIFSRDRNGVLGIFDYCIRGFFKEACGAVNRFDKDLRNGLEKLTGYKTKIDGCVFVFPRFIPVRLPGGAVIHGNGPAGEGVGIGICERPLRADTPQGPRVSLLRSETVPVGSVLEMEIRVMSSELNPYVDVWLGYGALKGLGQWRNSSKGRFTWEEIDAIAGVVPAPVGVQG